MRKINKICIDCKKPISTKKKKQKRCRECFYKFSRGENHPFYGKHHSESTKRKISQAKKQPLKELKKCFICGKILGQRNKSGKCQPCSRLKLPQMNEIINRLIFLDYSGRDKHRMAMGEFKCYCGIIFNANISKVRSGKIRSCGCSHIEHCKKLGKIQVGEKSPVWIKDRTKTSLYVRNKDYTRNNKGSWQYFSRKYKKIKKYTCELTGYKSQQKGDLAVHHLDSVLIKPDSVIDESNVVCIKKNLHLVFHKIYGKITTKEDWQQFVKLGAINRYHRFIKGTA